jgi:methyl-accepting chemotaxis protein
MAVIIFVLHEQLARVQEESLTRTTLETQKRIDQKNELLLGFITNISVEPLRNYNFNLLENFVASAIRDKNVSNIVFFDNEGEMITKRRLDNLTEDVTQLQSDVVSSDGEHLGRVEIYFNKESLQKDIDLLRQEQARNLRSVLLAAVVTSLVAGAFLVMMLLFMFRKLVSSRLEVMVEISEKISQRDLTQQIALKAGNKTKWDEIDRVINGYNIFVDRISEVLLQIKSASEHFADGAVEISSSAEKISQGAQQQTAYFEELSTSVENTAANASASNDIAKATEENAEETSEGMNKAISAITEIEESSNKISEAVAVITDIADQTNLLALNASIEAARAGEHGKGFAVVADEVRKLAERSTVSAKEITTLVTQSLTRVEEGVRLSKEAGQALGGIVSDMGKVTEQLSFITSVTKTQIETMKENTSIVESNAAAAEQMSSSSEEFSAQAGTLKHLVRQFKLKEKSAR